MKITKNNKLFLIGLAVTLLIIIIMLNQSGLHVIDNVTPTPYPTIVKDPSVIIVAANDSSTESKRLADYICDGRNDQVEIQQAISTAGEGGKVMLTEGTFSLTDNIVPMKNQELSGMGENATILYFSTSSKRVFITAEGVTCKNFQIQGKGYIEFRVGNLLFDHIKVYKTDGSHWAAFHGWFFIDGQIIQNVTFSHCDAIDCYGSGFMNQPSDYNYTYTIKDFSYLDCQAINSGRYNPHSTWQVGYDFAEGNGTIVNLLVDGCLAEGSWESGFHFEFVPTKINVVVRNSVSNDNCQTEKTAGKTGTFCAGYLTGGDNPQITLDNDTSMNEKYGFKIGNQNILNNCHDINSDFGFYLNNAQNVVISGGGIVTDSPDPILLKGTADATISGIDIESHTPSGTSYGIHLDNSVTRADRTTIRDSRIIFPVSPNVINVGIGNYGKNGLKVKVSNVTVIGASTSFVNCAVVSIDSSPTDTSPPSSTPYRDFVLPGRIYAWEFDSGTGGTLGSCTGTEAWCDADPATNAQAVTRTAARSTLGYTHDLARPLEVGPDIGWRGADTIDWRGNSNPCNIDSGIDPRVAGTYILGSGLVGEWVKYSHVYASAGTYDVTFWLSPGGGTPEVTTGTITLTINSTPYSVSYTSLPDLDQWYKFYGYTIQVTFPTSGYYDLKITNDGTATSDFAWMDFSIQ